MDETEQSKRNRNQFALLYIVVSAIVFAVRIILAVAHHDYRSRDDVFVLAVCSIGFLICAIGGIYLVLKTRWRSKGATTDG